MKIYEAPDLGARIGVRFHPAGEHGYHQDNWGSYDQDRRLGRQPSS